MAEQKNEVSFIYEKTKDARTLPVNGAYGGPTPDNSGVVVHFYLEYASVPHSTDIPIPAGKKKLIPVRDEIFLEVILLEKFKLQYF